MVKQTLVIYYANAQDGCSELVMIKWFKTCHTDALYLMLPGNL